MNKRFSAFCSFFAALYLICMVPTQGFSWSAPTQVSNAGMDFNSHGAVNAVGNGELVWTSGTYPTFSILSSTYSGVAWSIPVTIATGMVDQATVGIDSAGNAVAVWIESISGNTIIRSASKPVAGSWSVPTTLSISLSNFAPSLAMNAAGNAIAVWLNSTSNTIESAYLTFGGSWSVPATISTPPGTPLDIQITVDIAGNGYIIWRLFEGNDIYAATSLGTAWGPQVLLSLNGDNTSPSIGTGGVLQALTAWVNQNISEIRTAQFSGGIWNLIPSVISTDSAEAPVAAATGNDGVVAWHNINSGQIQVTNLNSGTWVHPPIDISISTDNEVPTISMLNSGTAVIAWSDFTNQTVKAVFYPNGGIPGVLQIISALGNNMNVQSASSGLRTIVTWQTALPNTCWVYATVN